MGCRNNATHPFVVGEIVDQQLSTLYLYQFRL